MARYKILSTKTLQPELVAQAAEYDIEIITQEFISIRPIITQEKYQEAAGYFDQAFVAVTSAHAAGILQQFLEKSAELPKWKIFCLSGRTKQSLSFAGENITDVADTATALAEKIIARGVKEIVFFCGNKRRDELPLLLKNAGIRVHEVILYETILTPAPVRNTDAVLFFSPLGVNSFFSVNQLNNETVCFAIGQTTADALEGHTRNRIIVSKRPTQEAMLEQVKHHFKQLRQAE